MNQQSESQRQNIYVGVGVMKDYKLKLRNLRIKDTYCLLLWIDEAKANIKPIYECRCKIQYDGSLKKENNV